MISMFDYHQVICRMRQFFVGKGFIEVPVQSRQSILAACEDPATIAQYDFGGVKWPLPQTGQVWLECELLKNPEVPGVFCISTSYRNEPNPIPGRHDLIFPMFEFESRGTMMDLMKLEGELLDFLGFKSRRQELEYEVAAKYYNASDLQAEHEDQMQKDFSPVVFLNKFPLRTHPFWNMKQLDENLFAKVDVILHGMETIGSAERSCNAEEMRRNFYHISHGQYAGKLFELFGKERVEKELEAYLRLAMTPRFGAGIGVTRMIRAMKKEGILKESAVTACGGGV